MNNVARRNSADRDEGTSLNPACEDAQEESTNPFRLLTVQEVLDLPDPSWLIDEVIPRHGIVQMYGGSNVGKTFIALDMALSVATGIKWLGEYKTVGSRVVYVVAEGHLGIKKRITAWLDFHGLSVSDLEGFRSLTRPLPLGEKRSVEEFLEAAVEAFDGEPVDLVVIDTQARCSTGVDENSATEMGVIIERVDTIKRVTTATVMLVHHTGYEKAHARGSTAVYGAMDTQSELTGDVKSLTLKCTKQKDWEDFDEISIKLLPLAGSLVPILDSATSPYRLQIAESRLPQRRQEALEALRATPEGLRSKPWREASGLGTSTFQTARKALVEAGLVRKDEGIYQAVNLDEPESTWSTEMVAMAEEVQRSTAPLGGGLLDPEARGEISERFAAAIEESR
jgi:AAA domain-containing protein